MTAQLVIDRFVRIAGQRIRIRRSAGTSSPQVKRRIEGVIDKLMELGHLDVVAAFAKRQLDASDLLHMDREGKLATLADIRINKTIWGKKGAANLALSKLPKGKTRGRYETSFRRLAKAGKKELGPTATLRDLESCDWPKLREAWDTSAADWMHMRRAVSRVLTLTLGSEHHPFRLSVMSKIPTMAEEPREPNMTLAQFLSAVAHAREDVQDVYMAMVILGTRLGEFLALKPSHLTPEAHEVRIPGRKTAGAHRGLRVNTQLWPFVARAVLSLRLKDTGLRKQWKAACERAGVEYCTLHDLRHLHAQFAVDAGAPDSRVQDSLGHTSSAMTRRYSRKTGTVQVSNALAGAIKQARLAAGKTTGTNKTA